MTEEPNWTLVLDWGLPHQGYFEKWTNYARTETTLELLAGGYADSTNDVILQVNVWAWDNLRQRYLTWNEITVSAWDGTATGSPTVLPLDTNSNVGFLMQDGQRTNLSFTFSPTNALPTNAVPGSYDYSFWVYPSRYKMHVGVDKNRDFAIDLDSGTDHTTVLSPYVFWVNDDNDTSGHPFGDAEVDWYDAPSATSSGFANDYAYNYVHTERDLEDYTRLDIRLPNILSSTNWFVRINFDGQLKFLESPTSGFEYLTDQTWADLLADGDYASRAAWYVGEVNGGYLDLPQSLFTNFGDLRCHLLLKAGAVSAGPLRVELYYEGTRIGSDSVYLAFRDVKDLYERYTVGNVTSPGIISGTEPDADFSGPLGGHFNEEDEDGKYLLFVHGWNMPAWEKYRFAETALKRLYWQGYKGRFGFFTWPAFYMENWLFDGVLVNYDKSEHTAWKSASRLQALLQTLDGHYPGEVRLMAHSMGNVVAGEALRLMGTNQVVRGYAAMQAAIPAHCYDGRPEVEAIKEYSSLPGTTLFTPNRYAEYWTSNSLPYLTNSAGAAQYYSYFNKDDFALVGLWDIDQRMKPDGFLGYHYSPPTISSLSGFYHIQTPVTDHLHFPQDRYKIFAFGAQPYSVALGASAAVEGVFESKGTKTDLESLTYGFGRPHIYHSGQFLSTIVKRAPFWLQISDDLDLK